MEPGAQTIPMERGAETETARRRLNRAVSYRNQMALTWCGPIYIVGFVIGFIILAGFIPPPHANLTANQIANVYRHNTDGIRAGLFIALGITCLYAPFAAVIATQMLRLEQGRRPLLTFVQLGNGVIGSLQLMIAFIIMMVAAFDPGRSPEITKVINELGWIMLVIPFAPFCIQYLAIATAILQDDSPDPLFPRWVAYYNILITVGFIPTGFVGFFHTGPFAWHGLIAFWFPVIEYGGWFVVMTWALRRAIATDVEPT
jgi:hypothetical protein